MTEVYGVIIAIISTSVGGTAAAVTRYLVGSTDPITIAVLRWGIGFLVLLSFALVLRVKWPGRSDWLPVAALGVAFFGVFFVLYNVAVSFTTAAREPRAFHAAAADHGGRGPAPRRKAGGAQGARRLHRGARRLRRPGFWS
jgi:hypothetical protein